MSKAWSARIAERYRCILSPTLADWFDREIWEHVGQSEYRQPIDPGSLIDAAPESIWPGLMSCDLLPLISNLAGDWLCVRIDRDDVASEVVQWYHGGGDWIPWGSNLAEAIVFDALVGRLPGPSRRHAIPAENPRPDSGKDAQLRDPLLGWALEHVPASVAAIFSSTPRPEQIAERLLEANVAEVAVRCELVLSRLMRSTREQLESLLREDSTVSRAHLAEWSFDADRIPAERRRLLTSDGVSLLDAQDWDAAAADALDVTRLAPELAWGWDIVGYAAERRGDRDSARRSYHQAAACSVFTDQSIRLATHWTAEQSAKFSVARLLQLDPEEVSESAYFSALCHQDTQRRRLHTTAYWREQAARFQSQNDFSEAHRCFVAAAWDVGAESIEVYAGLLEKIAENAHRSGQAGRSEIARTHRRCLQDRYGI